MPASADPEGGGGGQGVQTPPGKSQVIWVSIGNKQMDPPPPPPNSWIRTCACVKCLARILELGRWYMRSVVI